MYGKIFSQIYDGSLYGQWEALITFQQLIVLADINGEVDMTPEALSARTSIPLDIILRGIKSLEACDPRSRTPDEDGRRIVLVSDNRDWGWQITNYAHYRSIRTAEERREYFKEHKRKQRSKKLTVSNQSPPVSTKSPLSPPIVEVEVEVEADVEEILITPEIVFQDTQHQVAYQSLHVRQRNPRAFDAMLIGLVRGSGGQAYPWDVVGRALADLYTANGAVPLTPASIRAFCRRIATEDATPATLGRRGGATGDGIDWTKPIPEAAE